jgi:hypothetical protein
MRLLIPLLALALAACGSADDAPGGVSAEEARELNEAAAMLDVNSVSADAVATEAENGQ